MATETQQCYRYIQKALGIFGSGVDLFHQIGDKILGLRFRMPQLPDAKQVTTAGIRILQGTWTQPQESTWTSMVLPDTAKFLKIFLPPWGYLFRIEIYTSWLGSSFLHCRCSCYLHVTCTGH